MAAQDGLAAADLGAERHEHAAGLVGVELPVRPYVRLLLGMNWRAFDAEVRRIVDTGETTPELAEHIAEIWMRTLYPGIAGA